MSDTQPAEQLPTAEDRELAQQLAPYLVDAWEPTLAAAAAVLHAAREQGRQEVRRQVEAELASCQQYADAYGDQALASLQRTPRDYGGAALYGARASAAHLSALRLRIALDGEK